MDPQDLMLTALRASLIYFFLLVVVRLLGKREVGNASAFDLIVALMLGEVVDEAIYGDVSMAKGMLAIGVIALWHVVNSWASYKSRVVQKLTSAQPAVLVENGKIKEDALAKERLNEMEVFADLRLMGIDDIREVKLATLEPNGQVSVLQEDWAKPVQKQDVYEEQAEEAQKTMRAANKETTENNRQIQNPEVDRPRPRPRKKPAAKEKAEAKKAEVKKDNGKQKEKDTR